MKKIRGLLKLFRLELPISAGICVLLGQVFASGKFAPLNLAVPAFFAVFFISASALILNDYFDYETDKINAPQRPLPSGLVTPSEVIYLGALISLLGFASAYLIGFTEFLFSIILWSIGFAYNWKIKKTGLLGNIFVSFSVGMTFIFGGLSAGFPFNHTVLFFALIAALVDLGEEIAADAMDIEGDKKSGSNSIAVKYGKNYALRISAAVFILLILLTLLPFMLKWFAEIYLIPFAVMDLPVFYSIIKLLGNGSDREKRFYIRVIYLSSTASVLIFLLFLLLF